MSNKTYDVLKFVAMFVGYLATFILTLTDIWGFEYGAPIAASVSALAVLLSSVLQASSNKYWTAIDEGGDDDGADE